MMRIWKKLSPFCCQDHSVQDSQPFMKYAEGTGFAEMYFVCSVSLLLFQYSLCEPKRVAAALPMHLFSLVPGRGCPEWWIQRHVDSRAIFRA